MSNKTARLATKIIDTFNDETVDEIYNCLRQAVYGLPGNAVKAEDLVHEMAEILGKADPSSAKD